MVKVERSQPAPESLAIEAQKTNGSYNKEDVVKRLFEDFKNKCYICGIRPVEDPVIEHRLPHMSGRYKDRKFDWNNLFWSCPHCNSVKNNHDYDEGIIDCCVRDPEPLLQYSLVQDSVIVSTKDPTDAEAVRTAALIDQVFNLRNTQMRVIKSEVRVKRLLEEMNAFFSVIKKYEKNSKSSVNRRMIMAHLRRESSFSEFKRAYAKKVFKNNQEIRDMMKF